MISVLLFYAASLGKVTVKEYVREAKAVILRDTGKVLTFKYRPIRAGKFDDVEGYALMRYGHKFTMSPRKQMVLVRLGSSRTAGQAIICGNRAVAAIRPESRHISVATIAHELGHMLGAWHDSVGIMNPAPGQPGVEFRFAERSILEIEACGNDNND